MAKQTPAYDERLTILDPTLRAASQGSVGDCLGDSHRPERASCLQSRTRSSVQGSDSERLGPSVWRIRLARVARHVFE